MAYRRKTRKTKARKSYLRTKKRAAPRQQTIRLELHHVMTPQLQPVPVLGEGGGLAVPSSKKRSPKL